MAESTTSPPLKASHSRPGLKSKARHLFDMTSPDGPRWPLDEDIVANLRPYAGPVPRSSAHMMELIMAEPGWDQPPQP